MKSCPGCNFLVDDTADACRYCGAETTGVAPGTVAREESEPVAAPPSRDSVSTRLVAGVIVVASFSLIGVGAWAFHRTPPRAAAPSTPATPSPQRAVAFAPAQLSIGGATFRVDLPTHPAASSSDGGATYQIAYAAARELDIVHLPSATSGGPADMSGMLSTFSAGWPTTDVHTQTTKAGPAEGFEIRNGTELTRGVLIDAGSNGVILIALKAPVGSKLSSADTTVLERAVSTFAPA